MCFSANFWMIFAGATGSSYAKATPVGPTSLSNTLSYPVTLLERLPDERVLHDPVLDARLAELATQLRRLLHGQAAESR